MRLEITDASDEQLRSFAADTLQIDADIIRDADTRAKLLGVIGPAWDHDFIVLQEVAEIQGDNVTPLPQKVLTVPGRDDGPLVQIKLLQTDMPGGKHPAAPCVNGRMLVIQRNMLVKIPYAFFLALENAVTGSTSQEEPEPGKVGKLVVTEVTNYPMTDVIRPSKEEIDAWHARNGGRVLGEHTVANAA